MVEILTQYKELISIIAVAIVEIVVLLIAKKRPKVIDNSFVTKLCDWIIAAEDKFRNGSDKMIYVLEQAKTYLGDEFVESDVKKMVEYILTIPEKKVK